MRGSMAMGIFRGKPGGGAANMNRKNVLRYVIEKSETHPYCGWAHLDTATGAPDLSGSDAWSSAVSAA